MDIDISSIVVGVLALSTFFIPIFYYEVYKKGRAKKFRKQFLELSEEKNLRLSQYDTWRDRYAIGLDEKKNTLLYFRKDDNGDEILSFNPSRVTKCRVSKTDESIKSTHVNTTHTSRIDLTLASPDFEGGSRKIEFFNGEDGKTLMDENFIADKWARIINGIR